MKSNIGFVGFDGTERKRAIPAIHQVKESEGIAGDINILLRSPHARAKSMLSKFTRLFDVKAFLTDEKDRAAWEKVGARIEGSYDDFFEESDVIVVGTPEGQELPYVEASIVHDSEQASEKVDLAGGVTLRRGEHSPRLQYSAAGRCPPW